MATFSTSSTTKEAVASAGFAIDRIPGFGRKKHMLTGVLQGKAEAQHPPERVTIIGGGLAGAAAAFALAERGTAVTLREKAKSVAAGASANPSAIFYPGVTVGWQPQSAFYFMGYGYSLHLLRQFPQVAQGRSGMLLFPKPHETPERLRKVMATMQPEAEAFSLLDAKAASVVAGVPLSQDALYFPQNGWVDIGGWARALLQHPLIAVETGTEGHIDGLTLLCNGWQGQALHPALQGIMHPVRGQISHLPAMPELAEMQAILCFGGYLTPPIHGQHHLGATYDRERLDTGCHADDHMTNREKLRRFIGRDVPEAAGGWAALRSVTRDRLPLIGQVDDGVYASLAHASRGLLSCALAGEYLASLLHGEPLPLPRPVAERVSALRFQTG